MGSFYKSIERTGTVKEWVGAGTPPSNYLICDGSGPLLVANFEALYLIIGVRYGGTPFVNFYLPDLRGATIIGEGANLLDPSATLHSLTDGITGVERFQLLNANVANHDHTCGNNVQNHFHDLKHAHSANSHYHQHKQSDVFPEEAGGPNYYVRASTTNWTTFGQSNSTTGSPHTPGYVWWEGADSQAEHDSKTGLLNHSHTGVAAGGSGTHNTMQPSVVSNFIIRY